MKVGVMRLKVRLFGINSLKDKRSVVKRIINDLRKKYNVSISEVACQDSKVYMEIGVSVVSNDTRVIENTLSGVEDYIELYGGASVEESEKEIW